MFLPSHLENEDLNFVFYAGDSISDYKFGQAQL